METRRWVNQSLPQTLQIAVFLLYIQAAFTLLFGIANDIQYVVFPAPRLVQLFLVAGSAAGGFLIANEKKWGYRLGVAVAVLPLLARLMLGFGFSLSDPVPSVSPISYNVIGLLFEIALLALLLHTQSRQHQRIWFK
jgi:hypothetical protein